MMIKVGSSCTSLIAGLIILGRARKSQKLAAGSTAPANSARASTPTDDDRTTLASLLEEAEEEEAETERESTADEEPEQVEGNQRGCCQNRSY